MLWKIQEAKEMFTSRQINLGRCLPSSEAGICNIYRDFIKPALGEGDAAATTRTWRGATQHRGDLTRLSLLWQSPWALDSQLIRFLTSPLRGNLDPPIQPVPDVPLIFINTFGFSKIGNAHNLLTEINFGIFIDFQDFRPTNKWVIEGSSLREHFH